MIAWFCCHGVSSISDVPLHQRCSSIESSKQSGCTLAAKQLQVGDSAGFIRNTLRLQA
jgi:hypothetical protein